RRAEAASALAEGVAISPSVNGARDGLDRDVLDLIDYALEWRAGGPSPVAPLELLAELERADPGNAFWALHASDAEWREGLRADGRGAPAEGDEYLRLAIEAARRGPKLADTPESKRGLAQVLTVQAERLMPRGRLDEARVLLAEAAPLMN